MLILVDLDGTLIYRSLTQLKGIIYSIKISNYYYYVNHNRIKCLCKLRDAGHTIRIYSSIMYKNIEKIMFLLDPKNDIFDNIYSRIYNKKDLNGENSWDTIRDMDYIWKIVSYDDEYFGPENTILLDNEFRKFAETPSNGIVVKSLNAKDIKEYRSFKKICVYIKSICPNSDIRKYIINGKINEATDVAYGVYVRSSPHASNIRGNVPHIEPVLDRDEVFHQNPDTLHTNYYIRPKPSRLVQCHSSCFK